MAKPDLSLTEAELWNVLDALDNQLDDASADLMPDDDKAEWAEYRVELLALFNKVAAHLGATTRE